MELVFGLSADGRCYPDFPGEKAGAVGAAVVGPNGLVDILETQLGLRGPSVSSVARIAAWQAKLDHLGGDRFWSSSFNADPWATARLLLAWRDALVLAGWSASGAKPLPKRLQELREVEQSAPATMVGLGDRLWRVIEALRSGDPIAINTVSLIDDRVLLSPGFEDLIAALEARGVPIGAGPQSVLPTGSDLAILQSALLRPATQALSDDGSVVDLVAQTEIMLAEAVADWLLALGEDGRGSTVVIVESGSTALLDAALARRGLAKLGLSAASSFRGALQILPLAMALQWRPFNPATLLDLMLLPRPPIGRFAASFLATALSREPGQGGREWSTAWERIEKILAKDVTSGKRKPSDVEATLNDWRLWTTSRHFDPEVGMPKPEALAVAQRVIAWAVASDAGAGDALLMSVVATARALSDALESSQRLTFPRLLMEAMVTQAIGEGVADPAHLAQAGPVRVVSRAGAIWDKAERVVWFDFKDPGFAPAASPWDEAERVALAAEGCHIETPVHAAARQSSEWANALGRTGRQLVLARVVEDGRGEIGTHPLAHRLASVLGQRETARKIRREAEDLLTSASMKVGGAVLERQSRPLTSLPVKAPLWPIAAPTIARTAGRSESATTLQNLLSCSLKWLLSDVLDLRPGRAHTIPNNNTLLGNVAHALAQQLFVPGEPPDPDAVRKAIGETLDGLTEAIAAPLLQPGGARDMAIARRRIPEALAFLAEHMRARGLRVIATEAAVAGELGAGLKLHGRIDMKAELPGNKPVVIDFKWTNNDKYRREELEEGRAIQLAVYGRLVNGKGGMAPAGYYMLAQRKLLAEPNCPLATEAVDVARDLAQTALDIAASWKIWQSVISDGRVRATGVDPGEGLPQGLQIALPGPCKFCDFKSLCRVGLAADRQE